MAERRGIITDIIKHESEYEKSVEPVFFEKRIGSTNYRVNIHFSGMSKETMSDKIMRLIEMDIANA